MEMIFNVVGVSNASKNAIQPYVGPKDFLLQTQPRRGCMFVAGGGNPRKGNNPRARGARWDGIKIYLPAMHRNHDRARKRRRSKAKIPQQSG